MIISTYKVLLLQILILLLYMKIFGYYSISYHLYSIQKKWWHSSPILFILAVFSKAFIVTYFWINLFYIYRSDISKKTKYMLFASYACNNWDNLLDI